MKTVLLMLLGLTGLSWIAPVAAQDSFPNRPVRFIVPFPPGGGTDSFARLISAKLTPQWGQQVIVDNRGGAQGNIGTVIGARAVADGYTLTLAYVGTLAINPHIYSKPGFDALKDFAGVSRGTEEAWVMVVHPSVPAKTVPDLIALTKASPGKFNFASSASGTQLVGELFKLATGTDILHIPYKGAGPAVVDLLAGNVNMMFSNPTAAVPHVRSGRLRAMLVTGLKRLEALPQIQTGSELGIPQMNVLGWYGVIVPSATPRPIISRLNADIVGALTAPDVQERMRAMGQSASVSTPEEFDRQIRTDYEVWGKVVRASGVKVD